MRLGQYISDLERSSFEHKRIVDSIFTKSGRPYEIFSRYAEKIEDIEYWTKAHSALKIKGGFRPGKARHMVLEKMLHGLSINDRRTENCFWNFYRHCVVDCMEVEHNSLNQLLASCEISGHLHTTESIFTSIISNLSLYQVSDNDLLDLYEIFWFPRFDGIKELISQKPFDIDVVKKIVSQAEKKIEIKIENILKEYEEDKKLLAVSNKDITNKIANIHLELKGILEKIETRFNDFDRKSIKVETIVEKEKSKIQSPLELEKVHEITRVIETRLKEKIKKIEKDLIAVSKIREAEKENEDIVALSMKNSRVISVATEKHIISAGLLGKIFPDLVVKHGLEKIVEKMLDEHDCYYVDNLNVAMALWGNKFCTENLHIISASTSLVYKEDFEREVYKNNTNVKDQILVIQNFDLGFIDGYLVPLLSNQLSPLRNAISKIILIPSNNIDSRNTAKILPYAIGINAQSFDVLNRSSFHISAEGFANSLPTEDGLIITISKDCSDLRKVLTNTGVVLPEVLFNLFCKTYNSINEFYDAEDRLIISYELICLPFIKCLYGESKSEVVNKIIKGD